MGGSTGVDGQRAFDAERLVETEAIANEAELNYREPSAEEEAAGVAFSLSPSSPERNARVIEPVQIPASALTGQQADWRRAVHEFIAANLQGRSLVNDDTEWSVAFNSESKHQSVSKTHKEPQFRAAMQIVPIVERAVLLGDAPPDASWVRDTGRFHYFAVPVEIDGRSAVAWFNVRKHLRGDRRTFYEFGLFDETAQASPGLGALQPNTPTLGPGETVGQFVARVKGVLPAAMKVEGSPSFRLSAGSRLAAMQNRIDAALARDPEAGRGRVGLKGTKR